MVLFLLACGPAAAAELVEERQVLAAVRAFAYDRRLPERAGPEVQLAIVHVNNPAAAVPLQAILTGLGDFTIHDEPVRVVVLEAKAFLAAPGQIDVVLLAPGCGDQVPKIAEEAAKHGVLTAGFALDDVRHGAVLAVVAGQDHLRLVVDLDASRAAGAAFSSQLLQLAEIQ